ncbi:hypothetical protein HMPREF2835_02215 [Actinomyces sp. HMSC072A03]|nr:hypothetical protein HMPREF2835_02215 [Actinomyces sp. HMSC072A03]
MNTLLKANLRTYARRYLATGLAVAISMAFVFACLAMTQSLQKALTKTADREFQGVAAVATPAGTIDLQQAAKKLHPTPGIGRAQATVYGFLQVRANGEDTTVQVAAEQAEPFFHLDADKGKRPGEGEIVLTSQAAKSLHVKVGQTIRARSTIERGEFFPLKVSGLVEQGGMSSARSVMTEATMDKMGASMAVNLKVAGQNKNPSKADQQKAKEIVKHVLGKDAKVQTGAEAKTEMLTQMRIGGAVMMAVLLTFPAIALVVAFIVVSTTFKVVYQQRRRELALLRAVGATGRQVRSLLRKETLLVGAVASAVGILLGLGLALVALKLGNIPLEGLSPLLFLGVFVLGTALTYLVGMRPAKQVASVPPLAALSQFSEEEGGTTRPKWGRIVFGVILTVVGAAGLGFGIHHGDELGFLIALAGGIPTFLGLILLVSAAMPKLTALVGVIAQSSIGKMARANATRNPARTAATGTAIVIGVTLITMMSVGATSMRASLEDTLNAARPIDMVVTSRSGVLQADQIAKLRQVGGVAKLQVENAAQARVGGQEVTAYGVADRSPVSRAKVSPFSPDSGQVAAGLPAGATQVCVGQNCKHVQVKENRRLQPGSVDIASGTLRQLAPDAKPMRAVIRLEDNANIERAAKDITQISESFEIGGGANERAFYSKMINGALAVVAGLLAVSVLVALVGVANTLSLSVAERTRENGLLRALGLLRKQMRRMLLWEAALIAITGSLVGILLGIGFGIAGIYALPLEVDRVIVVMPWAYIAAAVLITLLAAALASWLPGRKAAKVPPVRALAAD